jgi:glycosyltransferase involved in cell wall biosynthesis
MNKKPEVSVILTFYNEEETLEELVRRLRNVFRNDLKDVINDYELIFVNDASTDRSIEFVLGLAKGNRDIKIINTSRKFGVYPCMLAGMRYSSGDGVIYLDSDLQDPPELIPEMVKAWLSQNADVVHTKRLSRAGESKIKLWITNIGYLVLGKISNIHIEPNVGDFKLLSRRATDELLKIKEKNPFVRGLVNWIGFKQTTIDYHRDARYAGKTKHPVYSWKVAKHFLDHALISFSDIPLKVSLFVGCFISFGAFCYLVILLTRNLSGLPVPDLAAIMATMLMLGGIQLMTIGVLGLYINAVFLEAKNRPDYIVESTYGFDEQRD